MVVTGPPTHSVGAKLAAVAGVCRRLSSSSVTLAYATPGAARGGGPVVLRRVRATTCYNSVILQIT